MENPARPKILLCDIQITILPAKLCISDTSTTQILSDLDSDLSTSTKVKSDGVIGLHIHVYEFLLVFNSNILPNLAHLRDMNSRSLLP